MKVLMLNGSARPQGNTFTALTELGKELERQGIEYEIFQMGGEAVKDCVACRWCRTNPGQGCAFGDDGVNAFLEKARGADGIVFGTPTYFAHPSGRILSFLDRLFFSSNDAFAFKPAACVAVARRGGASATFDVLNKYLHYSQMPIAGSTYWSLIHGSAPGEVLQDEEGLRTMRNLAKNLAWLMQCVETAKAAGVPFPETESGPMTNFIR